MQPFVRQFIAVSLSLFSLMSWAVDPSPTPGFYAEMNEGPRWFQVVDSKGMVISNVGGENPFHPGPIGSQGGFLIQFPHRLKWEPSQNLFSTNGYYVVDVLYQNQVYACYIESIHFVDFFETRLDLVIKQPSVVLFDPRLKKCFLREWKTKEYAFEQIGNGIIPVAWRETLGPNDKDTYTLVVDEGAWLEIELERGSQRGRVRAVLTRLNDTALIAEMVVSKLPKTETVKNLKAGTYDLSITGSEKLQYQMKLDGESVVSVEQVN